MERDALVARLKARGVRSVRDPARHPTYLVYGPNPNEEGTFLVYEVDDDPTPRGVFQVLGVTRTPNGGEPEDFPKDPAVLRRLLKVYGLE